MNEQRQSQLILQQYKENILPRQNLEEEIFNEYAPILYNNFANFVKKYVQPYLQLNKFSIINYNVVYNLRKQYPADNIPLQNILAMINHGYRSNGYQFHYFIWVNPRVPQVKSLLNSNELQLSTFEEGASIFSVENGLKLIPLIETGRSLDINLAVNRGFYGVDQLNQEGQYPVIRVTGWEKDKLVEAIWESGLSESRENPYEISLSDNGYRTTVSFNNPLRKQFSISYGNSRYDQERLQQRITVILRNLNRGIPWRKILL